MWRITQVNQFLLDAIKRGKAGRFWRSAGSSFFSSANIDSLKNPLTLTMSAHGSSTAGSAVPRHVKRPDRPHNRETVTSYVPNLLAGQHLSDAIDRTANQNVGYDRQGDRHNQQLQHVHSALNDKLINRIDNNGENEHSS